MHQAQSVTKPALQAQNCKCVAMCNSVQMRDAAPPSNREKPAQLFIGPPREACQGPAGWVPVDGVPRSGLAAGGFRSPDAERTRRIPARIG